MKEFFFYFDISKISTGKWTMEINAKLFFFFLAAMFYNPSFYFLLLVAGPPLRRHCCLRNFSYVSVMVIKAKAVELNGTNQPYSLTDILQTCFLPSAKVRNVLF